MPRFFAKRLCQGLALLEPDEAKHALKVLRMNIGDRCQVILEGALYEGAIAETGDEVRVTLGGALPSPEPTVRVTLYQGLPKGDKMEYIVQKCTEAGIFAIVPVTMRRCVTRLTPEDGEKKALRWQRIALEAGKQSGRAIVPRVEPPIAMKELAARLLAHELAVVPWEEAAGAGLSGLIKGQRDVALVIGPEGGMEAEEVDGLPAIPVTLGPRILRTETAGLAALISVMTLTGNMG